MTRSVLSYGRQLIEEDDIAAVCDVLRGSFLTQGPAVERFEAALAERVGARFAVAVSNGTAALHLAALAAGLGPGNAGITSPLTFVASANCLYYVGARAAFSDISPVSLGLAPDALRVALADAGAAGKAVIPVHFAGLAEDCEAIRAVAGDRIVIEDAAHALGGTLPGGHAVGSCAFSDMCCFSFHPVKPVTTGEGGAVTTNDPELAHRLRMLRSHGIERDNSRWTVAGGQDEPWHYEQHALGFNYRMTDLQAALGLSQLAKLERFLFRRREIALHYDAELRAFGPHIRPFQAEPGQRASSGLHLYVVAIDFDALGKSRGQVMTELREHGVGTQVHYIPVYRQPWQAAQAAPGQSLAEGMAETEEYYRTCLTIPMHPAMTDEDTAHVLSALQRVLMG